MTNQEMINSINEMIVMLNNIGFNASQLVRIKPMINDLTNLTNSLMKVINPEYQSEKGVESLENTTTLLTNIIIFNAKELNQPQFEQTLIKISSSLASINGMLLSHILQKDNTTFQQNNATAHFNVFRQFIHILQRLKVNEIEGFDRYLKAYQKASDEEKIGEIYKTVTNHMVNYLKNKNKTLEDLPNKEFIKPVLEQPEHASLIQLFTVIKFHYEALNDPIHLTAIKWAIHYEQPHSSTINYILKLLKHLDGILATCNINKYNQMQKIKQNTKANYTVARALSQSEIINSQYKAYDLPLIEACLSDLLVYLEIIIYPDKPDNTNDFLDTKVLDEKTAKEALIKVFETTNEFAEMLKHYYYSDHEACDYLVEAKFKNKLSFWKTNSSSNHSNNLPSSSNIINLNDEDDDNSSKSKAKGFNNKF